MYRVCRECGDGEYYDDDLCDFCAEVFNSTCTHMVKDLCADCAYDEEIVAERAFDETRCCCGNGEAEDDRGAVLRCPVHGPAFDEEQEGR